MKYKLNDKKYHKSTFRLVAGLLFLVTGAVVLLGFFGWRAYQDGLAPLDPSNTSSQEVTIAKGSSTKDIASQLAKAKLIKSAWSFEKYAQLTKAGRYLQAGTYSISPSQGVRDIIGQLTGGKVATKLITILPGQRLDQIQRSLVQQGFSEEEVDAALEPGQYESNAALADKPKGKSLEGYLYPESFQRTSTTTAKEIIEQSINKMHDNLTPDIVAGFKKQGISTYDGIIIASIVEKEVVHQQDRAQAAQVFLKRIDIGMQLGSDVTAFYGSELAGRGQDVTYDTLYNTRIHTGLPPTPISNVSISSLKAVSMPASTDWLFFVAGDDGTTYFSKTNEEHESLTKKYCIKLCQ